MYTITPYFKEETMRDYPAMPVYTIVEVDNRTMSPPYSMLFNTKEKAEFALKFIHLHWHFYELITEQEKKYIPLKNYAAMSDYLASLWPIKRKKYQELLDEGESKWGSTDCPFWARLWQLT